MCGRPESGPAGPYPYAARLRDGERALLSQLHDELVAEAPTPSNLLPELQACADTWLMTTRERRKVMMRERGAH